MLQKKSPEWMSVPDGGWQEFFLQPGDSVDTGADFMPIPQWRPLFNTVSERHITEPEQANRTEPSP